MQAPIHITPQSVPHNLETFSGTGDNPSDLSMAELSQHASLRLGSAIGDRHLSEPLRVGAMHTQPAEAHAGFYGTDGWMTAHHMTAPAEAEVDVAAVGGAERHLQHQQAQAAQFAQMVQLFQCIASQGVGMGGEGNPFQRTLADFARRSADQCADGSAAQGFVPTAPDFASSMWGGWPDVAMASAVAASHGLPLAQNESPFGSGQRVEELNQYIRQQAQEYVEGQAEWSRQIAEIKNECLRELEKAKRDKTEVERQAREELLRLRQRLNDAGIASEKGLGGEAPSAQVTGGELPSARTVGSWAAGVSMDEYQQVHRKWTAAEDRIHELEQYIKDQSAKHLSGCEARAREREDEVRALRQALAQSNSETRQARDELQALRNHHQQKVMHWEQSVQHVLAATEQFLASMPGAHHRDSEVLEQGKFGKTATRLSLTLPSEEQGGDVGSLRRRLKDVLKSQGKDKGSRKPVAKPKDEKAEATNGISMADTTEGSLPTSPPVGAADAAEHSSQPAAACSEEGDLEEEDEGAKHREGVGGSVQSEATSQASSRDVSPTRRPLNGAPAGTLHVIGRNGVAAPDSKVTFVAHLAQELRHLLLTSQKNEICLPTPALTRETSSLSVTSASSGTVTSKALAACGPSDRQRILQFVDNIPPARQVLAQNIITVEKMLRGLDQDLRRRCEELLGHPQLPVDVGATEGKEGKKTPEAAAEGEDSAEVREARALVPLSEDSQISSLTGLRHAQQQLASALVEFLKLPQKLKTVFDLTKSLSTEIVGLLPPAMVQLTELQACRPASQGTLPSSGDCQTAACAA